MPSFSFTSTALLETSQLLQRNNLLEVFGRGVSNKHDSRGIVLKGNISVDISKQLTTSFPGAYCNWNEDQIAN